MQVQRKRPVFKDRRGMITDILEGATFDSLTILTCKRGSVRGNHYHKATHAYAYVVNGRFRLVSAEPRWQYSDSGFYGAGIW